MREHAEPSAHQRLGTIDSWLVFKLTGEHDHVVTIEDGLVDGGVGALLAQRAREAGVATPVQSIGIPLGFLDHASRDQIVDALRLRPADVARDVLTALAGTVG